MQRWETQPCRAQLEDRRSERENVDRLRTAEMAPLDEGGPCAQGDEGPRRAASIGDGQNADPEQRLGFGYVRRDQRCSWKELVTEDAYRPRGQESPAAGARKEHRVDDRGNVGVRTEKARHDADVLDGPERTRLDDPNSLMPDDLRRLSDDDARRNGHGLPKPSGRLHGQESHDGAPEGTGGRERPQIGGDSSATSRVESRDGERARHRRGSWLSRHVFSAHLGGGPDGQLGAPSQGQLKAKSSGEPCFAKNSRR
jgi:hypothetical protein